MSRNSHPTDAITSQIAALSPAQRQLLERRMQSQGITVPKTSNQAIAARSATADCPLSFAQQRLWFIQQLEPESITYNVPCALRIQGELSIPALQQALNQLVDRHETLRTTFTTDSSQQPLQIIHPAGEVALEMIDYRTTTDPETTAQKYIQTTAEQPIDLNQRLVRWQLLQLAADDAILLITTHHIICDRWSVGVFLQELSILYVAAWRSSPAPLTPLPIQYADWAIWQRQQLQGDLLQTQLSYWQSHLAGDLPMLNLPTDRLSDGVYDDQTNQIAVNLSTAQSQQLRQLATAQGVTLFMLLLASFQVLLHHYTEQEDILIGTDMVNRDRCETEGLIGLLVNTLVLRTDLSGQPTFLELLARVREVTLQGYAHQQLPFEKIVEVLNPDRALDQLMPLFQVKFDLQLAKVETPVLGGLKLTRLPIADRSAKYDLRLNLQDGLPGISGQFEFDSARFSPATIARMSEHWQLLLTAIIAQPTSPIGKFSLLSPSEAAQLQTWNQTQKTYPETALHQLFETQAAKTPTEIALIVDRESVSYTDLNQKANRLAHYLQSIGVTQNVRVGILLDRQVDLVVTILAVLKTGGAYVPLDPSHPSERLEFILKDAQIAVLVSGNSIKLPEDSHRQNIVLPQIEAQLQQHSSDNLNHPIAPQDLAYLIYTSGSTGQPKSVAITHKSPVTLMHWAKEVFTPAELAGVLAATSVCFDLSIFELFVPLSWGGCVILAGDTLALPRLAAAAQVTLINTVPSAIRALFDQGMIPDSVRVINLAGEALPGNLVQQLYALPHITAIYNLYGPSEATTYSTYGLMPRTVQSPTIGRPIANTQVAILNPQQQPVPIGIAGELYLAGDGLAQGYWQRPELTAKQFIQWQGRRWYRTGDRARFLVNGEIAYLGRLDDQIKLRGYRIELGEIVACLEQLPEVEQAIVLLQGELESQQLIAYYIGVAAQSATLRDSLADRLPSYMLPAQIIWLEAFPLNANGKIDRQALSCHQNARPDAVMIAPRNSIERTIAEIWQRELAIDVVSVEDNFFALGGHSLLGMRIMAQISEALSQEVPLKFLFELPTISQLATQLSQQIPNAAPSNPTTPEITPEITPDRANRYLPFLLTEIQQAYLVGRSNAFELGNISTHGYREIVTTGLSIAAVEATLNQLIQHHEMLRMQVTPDGQQQILATVPPYQIPLLNLVGASASEQQSQLLAMRDRLSHQILDVNTYPLFYIHAVQLDPRQVQFCIGFDVLVGDAWSFQQLGQDFVALLTAPVPLPPITLSFRDYVLATQNQRTTDRYQQSQAYWQNRLATLPAAPELPLIQPLSAIIDPKFTRYSGRLDRPAWQSLKQLASKTGITPSSLVLAVFAEVLRRWSDSPDFTLNLTLYNRQPIHPEVNQIVGDFTASTLLEITNKATFADRARQIQSQLWQDLEHRQVSGVDVLRMLARRQQRPTAALMPVVFTSTLTQDIPPLPTDRAWQSEVIYGISQTSQVYLDHQVAEVDGALIYNWDAIVELFPPQVLDQMFAAYERLLLGLVDDPKVWQDPQSVMFTPPIEASLAAYNQTTIELDRNHCLHDLFFQQVARSPDHAAVITSTQQFTYQVLADRVLSLAAQIAEQQKHHAISTAVPIIIQMEKGWEQIVATLAVLTVGSAYVPIDADLPELRVQAILDQTGAKICLTQSCLELPESQLITIAVDQLATGLPKPYVASTSTDHLAYIIYTSGSTGTPKGVMIDHRSAVNTILDMNQRWQVNPADRVLALSSLSFDLSVYDIFGTLAAGATIVLPEASQVKQVHHWQDLIQRHQVTIWNSVPALFQLYFESCITNPAADLTTNSLRVAWLSGDWIARTFAEQIITQWPQLQLISLGGATEASIWSIFHPIVAPFDPAWQSIPYGQPLANQQIEIVNSSGQRCPPWVAGEIQITGVGVAQGYWHDADRTTAAFSEIPDRRYRTGDRGRYRPVDQTNSALTVEFLGRTDFQVKLNGYRIELGEINTAIEQYPRIARSIVQVVGEGNHQQLAAYIMLDHQSAIETLSNSLNPMAQLDFKRQQRHLRPIDASQPTIALPILTPVATQRRTHRQFLADTIDLAGLTHLLTALQTEQYPDYPLPRYRYASAGSLYPVQTYLYLKPDRISGVAGGLYYYHPQRHQLSLINHQTDWPGDIYDINQSIFEQAAFAIFLIADMAAIEPVYGDRSRDFCLLEAGYISQLLMEQSAAVDLGLCPIGNFDFSAVQPRFALTDQHQLMHSFVGGSIDPAATAVVNPPPEKAQPSRHEWLQAKLQASLEAKLPRYMVPQHFILLDHLPLTANGKVDLKSLPSPQSRTDREVAFAPPTTPIEQQLATILQSVLQLDQIGIDHHFFDLGGNSLNMMQILSQIQQQMGVDLPVTQFFTKPTIREQADWLEQQPRSLNTPLDTDAKPIQPVARSAPPTITQLSESDVDALLTQLLNASAEAES